MATRPVDLHCTMGQIIGQKYVALVLACIFICIAIAHWWKAFSQKYADHFKADAHVMTIIHPISMVGLTARGVVFAIIATILIFRFLGVESGNGAPPDVKDALIYVQYLPYGVWVPIRLGDRCHSLCGLFLRRKQFGGKSTWRMRLFQIRCDLLTI